MKKGGEGYQEKELGPTRRKTAKKDADKKEKVGLLLFIERQNDERGGHKP